MKVKDVVIGINKEVEKGLAAIGKEDIRERVKPRLYRHFVGVYFEREVRDRISKRFRGEVPENSAWSLKKEVLSYGQKLVALTGAVQIEQLHFDRIVDCVIEEHNKKASELRRAEADALRAIHKKERDDEKAQGPANPVKVDHQDKITLGMAVGAA